MRINATGLFDITREMAELIAEGGGGAIINIASMMGMFVRICRIMRAQRSAFRCPTIFFTKADDHSHPLFGTRPGGSENRVNCISPGGLYAGQEERFVANYSRKVPVGRMAEHDDIKGLGSFSPPAWLISTARIFSSTAECMRKSILISKFEFRN